MSLSKSQILGPFDYLSVSRQCLERNDSCLLFKLPLVVFHYTHKRLHVYSLASLIAESRRQWPITIQWFLHKGTGISSRNKTTREDILTPFAILFLSPKKEGFFQVL